MSVQRISDFVEWFASHTPDAEAAVLNDDRITYAMLRARVDAVARALLAAGVRKGDRVATLSPPSPDFLVTFLASASVGAIWLGLNPKYRTDELTYVVGDAEPVVLFARTEVGSRRYDDEIAAMVRAAPSIRHVVTLDVARGAAGIESRAAFTDRGVTTTNAQIAAARADCGGRDACLLVYTSGSTGQPKGALLHHEGLAAFSTGQNQVWPLSSQRFLNYFPINHVGCVVDTTLPTLAVGGCLVFLEKFAPDTALALMEQERVSAWASVPTVFQLQLALPDFDRYDLSAVELIIWEGAAMPVDVIRRLRAIQPRMATNYGMTETTSAITIVSPTDDEDVLANSVGVPFDNVDIRLVSDDGTEVATGATGEVQVRSMYNMLGYWRKPDATAAAFTADGWFRTGDLAMRRSDGRYRIVGRIKEMYKSGGYNVYPREVEDVLQSHVDVVMAAVVGCPDQLWQEAGVAFVVARPTLDLAQLQAHCRGRLANYKIPKRFVLCEALPLLPIGKVDKVELSRRAREAVHSDG